MRRKAEYLACLLLLLAVGCSTKKLVDSDFCRLHMRNLFERTDGESSPIPFQIDTLQTLTIQYVGQWQSGTAEMQVQNDQGESVWQQPIEQTDVPKTIIVTTLKPGKYTLYNIVHDGANGTICTTSSVK